MKKFIVAFPDDEFAISVHRMLAKDGFVLNPIEKLTFRDKEIKIRIRDNVRKSECFFIHNSNHQPNDWFLELAIINEALYNSSASEITDVLPYLRFSRQDRKDRSRVGINAKVLAELINLHADRVMTIEVHSPQVALGYSIPFDSLYSFPTVIDYLMKEHAPILKNLVLMSPDSGGVKRVEGFRNKLSYNMIESDMAIGYKYRKKEGEVSELRMIGEVRDKNVLIIDDIIDSGSTLTEVAKELKRRKARKIYAFATHGLFTEGVKVVQNFEKVFVSNTLKPPEFNEKLEIISVTDLFAEAIRRISEGESLSELFETHK